MSSLEEVDQLLSGIRNDPDSPGSEVQDLEQVLESDEFSLQAEHYNALSYHSSRGEGQGGTNNLGIAIEIARQNYERGSYGENDRRIASLYDTNPRSIDRKRRELKDLQVFDQDYELNPGAVVLLDEAGELGKYQSPEEEFSLAIAKDIGAFSNEGGSSTNLESFLRFYKGTHNLKSIGRSVFNSESPMPVHYAQDWRERGLVVKEGNRYRPTEKGKIWRDIILHHNEVLRNGPALQT